MPQYCVLFGHWDAPDSILPQLEKAVALHYRKYRVREFVVGRRGNFDALAVRAVRTLQKQHPRVGIARLLPRHPSLYKSKLDKMGKTFYPEELKYAPKRIAFVLVTQKAIDTATSVICHVNRSGAAQELMEYAQKVTGYERVENIP